MASLVFSSGTRGWGVTTKKQNKTPQKRQNKANKAAHLAEYKFKSGNKAAVGHGRPRTIGELRDLIQDIGAEKIHGADLTRLELLLRGMFASRNAADRTTILKYGWGNVPVEFQMEWREQLRQAGIDDSTAAEQFEALVQLAAQRLGADVSGGDNRSGTKE